MAFPFIWFHSFILADDSLLRTDLSRCRRVKRLQSHYGRLCQILLAKPLSESTICVLASLVACNRKTSRLLCAPWISLFEFQSAIEIRVENAHLSDAIDRQV